MPTEGTSSFSFERAGVPFLWCLTAKCAQYFGHGSENTDMGGSLWSLMSPSRSRMISA